MVSTWIVGTADILEQTHTMRKLITSKEVSLQEMDINFKLNINTNENSKTNFI